MIGLKHSCALSPTSGLVAHWPVAAKSLGEVARERGRELDAYSTLGEDRSAAWAAGWRRGGCRAMEVVEGVHGPKATDAPRTPCRPAYDLHLA